MRVALLGPLRVESGAGVIPFAAAKERSLLAALALNVGHVVGADALVDYLWGDAPPATARKTLQTYVTNVRRAVGPDLIVTEGAGYVLRVDRQGVDVARFRTLLDEGEDALREGSIARAQELLRNALALWRGDPFDGVAARTALAGEAVRLREEHLAALEARITADLLAGEGPDLVPELEALVREHPFRERLWGHLLVALYRSGRQADALAAYQRARGLLREELGLEPGGELRRIEQAVLDQDPTLDGPPASRSRGASRVDQPLDVGRPPVRYARTADGVHIAYRVVGSGPVDVIAIPGFVSHLDMWWDAPTDELVRRLGAISRLLLFDKRGMGLSDRPPTVDIEHWVEDALAVLDAVGSRRAVVLGISAGAPTAALLSALHPERARALILWGGYARFLRGDGYDVGYGREVTQSFIDNMLAKWGSGVGLSILAPSLAADPAARGFWARLQTISASPGAATTFLRALSEVDVRHALPEVQAPTLILHATRDLNVPVQAARYSRDLIPDATLVELDSDVHMVWLSDVVDEATDEIAAFIKRTVPASPVERVLATILVAAGTDRASWPAGTVAAIVDRWKGRPLPGATLATFDGPSEAIGCAQALIAELDRLGHRPGAAVHSGECTRVDGRISGIAVSLAEQLAAAAAPGEILVTQTIRDLVADSGVGLEPRGSHRFRGIPGAWDVLAVSPGAR